MSPWQFRAYILPSAMLGASLNALPTKREQTAILGDELNNIVDEGHVYWRKYDHIAPLEAAIGRLLPEVQSWSSSARMFGDSKGDRVEIWKKGSDLDWISFAFSLSTPNADYIKSSIETIAQLECVFLGIQSKSMFEPTIQQFITQANACSAIRYLPEHMTLSMLLA